ncbi:MFS transporter [Halorarius litoreus]|uniref:MFS transporter n=1 Tax=Halorarius litoreus TaxID=2962676 RepID=UPI0020CC4042|nr:MFS transporter [Halorarius litoreus]
MNVRDPTTRRWLLFGVLAAAYVLVAIYRLSTAVLADRLAADFAATGAELGVLHSSFFVVYAALQIPAGALADRAGARWSVAAGTAIMSVGGLVFALAPSFAVAFLARGLVGLGGSFLFIAILRFAANWFRPSEFGRLSGLTIAIAGLGSVLATTPLAVVVAAAGWRETVAGLAVVGFLLAALVAVFVRDSPADAGLQPVGGVPTPSQPSLRGVVRNARRVFDEPETWLAGAVLFAGTGINITVFGLWGVPYVVQTYGVSVTRASLFTLAGSAGILFGPPTIGALSDRLGTRTPLIVAGIAVYTSVFTLLAVVGRPPLPLVGVVFFLAGTLTGTFALTYSVVKERHDAGASGVSTGTVNTVGFAGAAILPPAMGLVLDRYATGRTIGGATVYSVTGYRVAFGLAAAVALVGFGCAVVLYWRTRSPLR